MISLEWKAPPTREVRVREPFDFCSRAKGGPALFVGEGNLSFACSVAERAKHGTSIVATTHEAVDAITEATKRNRAALHRLGANVLHGVNATSLGERLQLGWHTIVFQFPNAGSRRSVHGGTANHHLIRRFLRSCRKVLSSDGSVAVSTVDSAYYHGVFDVPRAAEATGFAINAVHPFYRTQWDGYGHTNTLDVGSALRASYRVCTWILSPHTTSSRPWPTLNVGRSRKA